MRLDRNQLICDIPVKIIRDFFRKHCSFHFSHVCEVLCLSDNQAHELIKKLEFMELIENNPETNKSNEVYWRTTIKGNSFAGAKFLKPLEKEKAWIIIDSLLERVQNVNKDNNFLFAVTYVGLFGSLSQESKEVGDIDLVIKLSPKIEFLEKGSFTLDNGLKILKFLKNRNPYINIHDEHDLQILNITPQQLFPIIT